MPRKKKSLKLPLNLAVMFAELKGNGYARMLVRYEGGNDSGGIEEIFVTKHEKLNSHAYDKSGDVRDVTGDEDLQAFFDAIIDNAHGGGGWYNGECSIAGELMLDLNTLDLKHEYQESVTSYENHSDAFELVSNDHE